MGEKRCVDAEYRELDYQPVNIGLSGGDYQNGPSREVSTLKAIVEACADAEFAFSAELDDLVRALGQWGHFTPSISRRYGHYQAKNIEDDTVKAELVTVKAKMKNMPTRLHSSPKRSTLLSGEKARMVLKSISSPPDDFS